VVISSIVYLIHLEETFKYNNVPSSSTTIKKTKYISFDSDILYDYIFCHSFPFHTIPALMIFLISLFKYVSIVSLEALCACSYFPLPEVLFYQILISLSLCLIQISTQMSLLQSILYKVSEYPIQSEPDFKILLPYTALYS
jgi:hypothetical protein